MVLTLPLWALALVLGLAPDPGSACPPARVCLEIVRAQVAHLSSDGLKGRGSASADEKAAAEWAASELAKSGIAPAGDEGGFLQRIPIERQELSGPPVLAARNLRATHGKEALVLRTPRRTVSGRLRKVTGKAAEVSPEEVILLLEGPDGAPATGTAAWHLVQKGAPLVVWSAEERLKGAWERRGRELPRLRAALRGAAEEASGGLVALDEASFAKMRALEEGTPVTLEVPLATPRAGETRNVLGKLPGADSSGDAILLSAHLDGLGVGREVDGDAIYNGANDDASGVVAVLQLARALSGARPRRSVYFCLFGSEEEGGLGSSHFRDHPPVPLERIVANIQFEMVGKPDPAVSGRTLWMTGWERSNLGPRLAEQGARLVADPRPKERFFERSDNYPLAKRGVVAHSISSGGEDPDYHKPSDEVSRLDLAHLTEAVASLVAPVRWLASSDFRPAWSPSGRP